MSERSIASAARAALQTLVDQSHDTEYQDLVTAVTEITNAAIDRMDVEISTIKAVGGAQSKQIELLSHTVRAQAQHTGQLETTILQQAAHIGELETVVTEQTGQIAGMVAHIGKLESLVTSQTSQIVGLGEHIGKLETTILTQAKTNEETARRFLALEGIAARLLAQAPLAK